MSLFQSSVWWFQWRQMKHLMCVKCRDRHLPEINLIYRNVINININHVLLEDSHLLWFDWSSFNHTIRHAFFFCSCFMMLSCRISPTSRLCILSQKICMTALDGNVPPFAFSFACLLKIWLECESESLLTPERLNKASHVCWKYFYFGFGSELYKHTATIRDVPSSWRHHRVELRLPSCCSQTCVCCQCVWSFTGNMTGFIVLLL